MSGLWHPWNKAWETGCTGCHCRGPGWLGIRGKKGKVLNASFHYFKLWAMKLNDLFLSKWKFQSIHPLEKQSILAEMIGHWSFPRWHSSWCYSHRSHKTGIYISLILPTILLPVRSATLQWHSWIKGTPLHWRQTRSAYFINHKVWPSATKAHFPIFN